jgi:hypothetical protein
VSIDEESSPFPWNSATHSVTDGTRIMLDLKALETRYGDFYIKGAALWAPSDETDTQKRLRLEQADYRWADAFRRLEYSVRLFANERRFFTNDRIVPLLDDDRVAGGENRGVRADATIGRGLGLSALFSLLDDDVDDARRISYLRAIYSHRLAALSVSYLFDDANSDAVSNHAVFKTELSTAYRWLYAALAYEQSGFESSNFFFPSGTTEWGKFGDGVTRALPENGALAAEARMRPVSLWDAGSLRLVWRYETVREAFANDLSLLDATGTGNMGAAFFKAKAYDLGARLVYRSSSRSVVEHETSELVEAGVWGTFKNGMQFLLRGNVGETNDDTSFDMRENFLHAAVYYRFKKLYSGAHIMWKDIDTAFSERRFAWDGKLAINPDWGFYWRFMLTRDFAVGQTAFVRLDYRPADRIYATFDVGRDYIGDEPFLLEDPELDLSTAASTVYRVSIRGDF